MSHTHATKDVDYYISNKLWPTRDQGDIHVSAMADSHILASIAKCTRDNWRLSFIPVFLAELESRGFKQSHPELFI